MEWLCKILGHKWHHLYLMEYDYTTIYNHYENSKKNVYQCARCNMKKVDK